MKSKEETFYSIGEVAELVGMSARMIREYERMDLIRPRRVNGNRRFSEFEVQFIGAIRYYLDEIGMSINGLRILFQMAACWELKQCTQRDCPAWRNASAKCYEILQAKGGATGGKPCRPEMCQHCPICLASRTSKSTRLKINLLNFPKLGDGGGAG